MLASGETAEGVPAAEGWFMLLKNGFLDSSGGLLIDGLVMELSGRGSAAGGAVGGLAAFSDSTVLAVGVFSGSSSLLSSESMFSS